MCNTLKNTLSDDTLQGSVIDASAIQLPENIKENQLQFYGEPNAHSAPIIHSQDELFPKTEINDEDLVIV